MTGIKRKANVTMEAPAQIRARAMENVATPVLAQLPTKKATNLVLSFLLYFLLFPYQIVQRVRREIAAYPAVPQNINELQIPDVYRHYQRTGELQEQFLLADSGVYIENETAGQHRLKNSYNNN